MRRSTNNSVIQRIMKRTEEIQVGGTYFLSSFYDKDGAWVKVISKSTKENKAGWPSTVVVESLGVVGEDRTGYYATGTVHSVNATNLYEKQEMASH